MLCMKHINILKYIMIKTRVKRRKTREIKIDRVREIYVVRSRLKEKEKRRDI